MIGRQMIERRVEALVALAMKHLDATNEERVLEAVRDLQLARLLCRNPEADPRSTRMDYFYRGVFGLAELGIVIMPQDNND